MSWVKKIIFKLTDLLYHICLIFWYPFLWVSRVKPSKIVFFVRHTLTDNIGEMYWYIRQKYSEKDVELICLFSDMDCVPQNDIIDNKINLFSKWHEGPSFAGLRCLATCGVLFYEHYVPWSRIKKKNGQKYLNLWHGCGYKDLGKFHDDAEFEMILATGSFYVDIFAREWNCDKEKVLALGYPRFDLFRKDAKVEKYLNSVLNINTEKQKIIIWMPTYRQSENMEVEESRIMNATGLPLFETIDLLRDFNDFCLERKIMIVIKRHPAQKRYPCETEHFSNILFLGNDDLYENDVELYNLLYYTDALISDYSSVAVDYLLIDRPIGYVLSDFDEYKSTRGFSMEEPLKYMPGNHIYNLEDLLKFVLSVSDGEDHYIEARNEVKNKLHCQSRECYCESILNTLISKKLLPGV